MWLLRNSLTKIIWNDLLSYKYWFTSWVRFPLAKCRYPIGLTLIQMREPPSNFVFVFVESQRKAYKINVSAQRRKKVSLITNSHQKLCFRLRILQNHRLTKNQDERDKREWGKQLQVYIEWRLCCGERPRTCKSCNKKPFFLADLFDATTHERHNNPPLIRVVPYRSDQEIGKC